MMNPNLLFDLVRERHRDLLDDARLSRLLAPRDDSHAADSGGLVVVGRSARVIDARARAESRSDYPGAA